MTPEALLSMALCGWILAGFTATGAKVLRDFSRHEIEEYCRRRRNVDRNTAILDQHDELSLDAETLQVVGAAIGVIAGFLWLVGPEAGEVLNMRKVLVGITIGSVGLLAATVWIPWSVVRFWSAPFLYHTWPCWLLVGWLLAPLSLGAHLAEHAVRRLTGRLVSAEEEEEAFEDEVRAIVTEGIREGHIGEDAREMIEGVMDLDETDVADIMTPRSSVDAIDVQASWDEVIQFVGQCGRTRIPVYAEDLDNIVGVLYAKDILPELAGEISGPRRKLEKIARPSWFVPHTRKVNELLRDFLRTHNHLAIVIDEFDRVAGVVTIEDALEEIVGEIVDEYDQEEELPITQVDDHTAEVLAGTHIDEVNEHFGLDLPDDEDFDTIGGFVITQLGRIPRQNDTVVADGIRITVLEASRRRPEKLRLELQNGAR